jgi:hypothetical protein
MISIGIVQFLDLIRQCKLNILLADFENPVYIERNSSILYTYIDKDNIA